MLIAEDKQSCTHQFLLSQQGVEFGFGILKSEFIGAIDDPNNSIGLFEVVPPVGPDGSLSSDVPDVEFVVFVVEGLDVEAEGGGDLVDVLAVEFFDDGGFAGVVEAEDEEPHFLLFLFGFLDD